MWHAMRANANLDIIFQFSLQVAINPDDHGVAIWNEKASLCLKTGPPLRPMRDTPAIVNSIVSTSPFLRDG